jgi:hypothetical protein
MKRKALISPGFGGGWSTWADSDIRDDMLFDEKLIAAVEEATDYADIDAAVADFVARMEEKHDDPYIYTGGARDLQVAQVEGQFIVEEYDGSESILTRDDTEWT